MKVDMQNISKSFFGALVLEGVDFTVLPSEIHALLGENGAGKTTLMNILYGLYEKDGGTIRIDDEPVSIRSPKDALAHGIGMVHQHFQLVDTLSVADNITLGLKEDGYPFSDPKKTHAKIRALCDAYGLSVDPAKKVKDLVVGERQMVEIIKLLYRNARLFILDEPTAVLSPPEIEPFFHTLLQLKKAGHSMIIITHKIHEVEAISDRVTVLRDGRRILSRPLAETNEFELSQAMIGRTLHPRTKAWRTPDDSACRLALDGVTVRRGNLNVLNNVSLRLAPGEIVGVAGVDGNGQQELAEAILGIQPLSAGAIRFEDRDLGSLSINDRFDLGIGYIPADRHQDALLLPLDLRHNLLLRKHRDSGYRKHGFVGEKKAAAETARLIDAFAIKVPPGRIPIRFLSGGNQQKFVLARELTDSLRLLVAFQPTRGLDMGATEFIRNQLLELSLHGTSILLISTDLQEIISLSDRIMVLHKGENMGIIANNEHVDIHLVGSMMGGRKHAAD